jgi:hypothetical protein
VAKSHNDTEKNSMWLDFPQCTGGDEIAAAIPATHDSVTAEKKEIDDGKPNEPTDSQSPSVLTSVFDAATRSLGDAVAAISEAGAAVADKAVEVGAAGVERTTDAATRIAQASANAISGVGLTSAIEYLDDAIDEQAIKAAIVEAAEAVGDKVDQVTGKQLVEMLEEKLRRQDEYNDILATRLAEALQRIAALEQKLEK